MALSAIAGIHGHYQGASEVFRLQYAVMILVNSQKTRGMTKGS